MGTTVAGRMAGDRDERGAVLPFVAVMLTLILAVAALATDLGMQRVVRRDMQAMADVVALDLARHLDGRTAAALKPEMDTQRNNSVAQNKSTLGDGLVVTYKTGGLLATGVFSTSISPPTAVQVTASAGVDFAFAPGRGTATRSAISATVSNACFSVGSFAAGLGRDPGTLTALLNPILGDTTLTAVSYQGLAAANVSLLDLIQAPTINVGSVSALLSAGDISVGDILLGSASVLRNQGGATNIVQATLLEHLATTSVVSSTNVNIGNVLGLSTAGEGALDASFNVLDLVAGAATVANGTNFVGAPAINLSVPNLATTTQSISITEAAHTACGQTGAVAKTAQVKITAGGMVGTTVPVPLGGTITIGGPLSVAATVAQATGTLGAVTCAPDVIPIKMLTELATMNQSAVLAIVGNDIGLGSVLGLPGLITADIKVGQTVASSLTKSPDTGTTLSWTIPPDSYATQKHTGSGDYTLPHASVTTTTALVISDIRVAGVPLADVRLLGLPIGAVLQNLVINTVNSAVAALLGPVGLITGAVAGLVTNTVNPVIDSTNLVVGKLAKALGLELGGADVNVLAGTKCNSPVLRG